MKLCDGTVKMKCFCSTIKLMVSFFLSSQLVVLFAYGENNFIVDHYNAISNNRSCDFVSDDEANKIINKCHAESLIKSSFATAYDIFENVVFNESAQKQFIKNKCVIEQATDLFDNHQKFYEWRNELLSSWLRWKKSKLLLAKCKTMSSKIAKDGKTKNYYFPGFVGPVVSKDKDIINICLNSIEQIKEYDIIFSATLPYISGPKFFEIIDEHRSIFVNAKTGIPVSDLELLSMDLKALENTNIALKPEESVRVSNALKQEISKKAAERKKINLDLEKTRDKNGNFYPSQAVKDFIFKEGTVLQMLYENDIGPNQKINSSTKCLLNKYEESEVGEILDFITTSLVSGGLIYKAVKIAPVKGLKSRPQLGKVLDYGISSSIGLDLIKKELPKCISSIKNMNNQYHSEEVLKNKAKSSLEIPEKIGYENFAAEVDLSNSPSCQALGESSLVFLKPEERYCLRALLTAVLVPMPVKLSLPAMVVLPNQTEK